MEGTLLLLNFVFENGIGHRGIWGQEPFNARLRGIMLMRIITLGHLPFSTDLDKILEYGFLCGCYC